MRRYTWLTQKSHRIHIKIVLDVIVKVVPVGSNYPPPKLALVTFADEYSVHWEINMITHQRPVTIVFYVRDTEFVPLMKYPIVLDKEATYERTLYSNTSGMAVYYEFKQTWLHITLYDPYPPKSDPKLGNEAREFTFVWVSAILLCGILLILYRMGRRFPYVASASWCFFSVIIHNSP